MLENRDQAQSPYTRSYLISVATHAIILLALSVVSVFNGCQCLRRKNKLQPLPIEFTVAIPEEYFPAPEPDSAEGAQAEETKPAPPDEPEPIAMPDPEKPKDKPKDKPKEPEKPKEKPKFEKSKKIVERKPPKEKPREIIKNLPKDAKPAKVKGPKLTAEEIQKLIDAGATPSDRTSVPGEDDICLLAIKKALYKAWIVPSAEHFTGRPALIEITLGPTGAIVGHRLVEGSGNRVLDNSALDAAAAVRHIPGISSNFLRSRRKVTIAFDLEQ
ncbi:MAG: TonB family protein [Kiritimatiellia bacterium]|jgi:protein TonB